uniref:Uncharacterized protein n=1 Tax=Anopheles melas TaxID=34690 RepID=A0A182TLV5_9DIPT
MSNACFWQWCSTSCWGSWRGFLAWCRRTRYSSLNARLLRRLRWMVDEEDAPVVAPSAAVGTAPVGHSHTSILFKLPEDMFSARPSLVAADRFIPAARIGIGERATELTAGSTTYPWAAWDGAGTAPRTPYRRLAAIDGRLTAVQQQLRIDAVRHGGTVRDRSDRGAFERAPVGHRGKH